MVNESSMLAVMNPLVLLLALAVFGMIAYFCARRYCNTNDFARSVKLYVPVMLGADVLFFLLGLPVVLLAGIDVAGFVALALISNHYFYN